MRNPYKVVVGAVAAILIAVPIYRTTIQNNEATDHCFAQPGACGFPDPSYNNVGVPPGTSLTASGAITVSTPGQVVDGLDITTSTSPAINVTADNVTIKNTRVTGSSTAGTPSGSNQRLIETCSGCDTLIQDVELTTTTTGLYEFAVHGTTTGGVPSNDTLLRVYQHGNVDMMLWCEGVCSVTDSYSHLGKPNGTGGWTTAITDDHTENLYCNDCTFTADHNTLLLPMPQTSPFFAQTNNGVDGQPCVNQLTITDNLLAGGGQIITMCAHSASAGTATATITNNRIARCGGGDEEEGGGGTWLCPGLTVSHNDGEGYYPNGGSFGLTNSYYSSVGNWSGNVWDENSETIPEP
jgi:hypothetical protein